MRIFRLVLALFVLCGLWHVHGSAPQPVVQAPGAIPQVGVEQHPVVSLAPPPAPENKATLAQSMPVVSVPSVPAAPVVPVPKQEPTVSEKQANAVAVPTANASVSQPLTPTPIQSSMPAKPVEVPPAAPLPPATTQQPVSVTAPPVMSSSAVSPVPVQSMPPISASAASAVPVVAPVAQQGTVVKMHEPEPEESLGIDTLLEEEPQGNWLFKRIWWQHSEASYEKLRKLVDEIHDVRMRLLADRRTIEHEVLDPFYLNIGIGQGELQALIADLLGNKQRAIRPDQTDQQRELMHSIEEDRVQLEQLQRDVNAIVTLEAQLDNAIDMLTQQVEQVRMYEQNAWQHFKDVSRVLNDKKAQELFYKIKGAAGNIRSILDYLKGSFSTTFNELIQKITQQVNNVKASLQALKEKGVILKGAAQQLEEAEQAKRLKACSATKADEEEETEESSSWLGTLAKPFVWVGNTIISIIRAPYDIVRYIFGVSSSSERDEGEE